MTADIRKVALAGVLGAFFLATSQDAHMSQSGADTDGPVCSDKPAPDSVARMQAIQSLRETQVEIEMMKKHQAAASAH